MGRTLGGPIRETFFFASFEQLDITDANLVTIQESAAALLNQRGFPVELKRVPFRCRTPACSGRSSTTGAPTTTSSCAAYADVENENIEPFGGIVARAAGDAAPNGLVDLGAADRRHFEPVGQRVPHVRAPQDQEDQLAGSAVRRSVPGGGSGRTRSRSRGRERRTPASPNPRRNRRLQFAETISFLAGSHHLKAGLGFQPHRGDARRAAAPFRTDYIFSAVPALGIPSGLEAFQPHLPAYVQGMATRSSSIRRLTSRCSFRTSGSSDGSC